MSIVSNSLKRIKPSPTLTVSQKARELKAAGEDVIGLGAGEPDFDTPENIKKAAIEAINKGETKYTAVDGTPALKKAIVNKFKRENNLDYLPEQISVGAGGKQIIFNAILATVNPGDEVIIPAPYWVSYPDIVILAEGKPVIVKCEASQNFKITPDQLEKHITDKTKWLMLNSPSNPTGSVYSFEELKALSEVLIKYPKILVLTDDIYEKIIYDDNKFFTIASVEPKIKDRVLTLNGVSKAYCMTGWRLGYCGGPKEIISGMNKIQSQSTTSTSSITMAAADEALNGDQEFIKKHNKEFKKRRDLVVEKLSNINGLSCDIPPGAFYVYPCCEGIIGKKTPEGNTIATDEDLMNFLLESEGIAGVHGAAFGLSPYFRLSYATDEKTLIDACERIRKACSNLK